MLKLAQGWTERVFTRLSISRYQFAGEADRRGEAEDWQRRV
jgi:hypothetical protein